MTPLRLLAAALQVPLVLAQASSTTSDSPSSTTTTEGPSCSASLIATLCDYKKPGPEFAVASSGKEYCWEYCSKHQPCNFVVFVAGNPHTGTGTCWLYPGENFDPKDGTTEGCQNQAFSVFAKPECASPSEPNGCAATESPSPIAEVCDYPPPDESFFSDWFASSDASNCLSICAKAESCEYAVFVLHNPSGTPYASGSCWVYPQGSFDNSKAGACNGKPEQFVYSNVCPKPKPTPSLSTAASKPSSTGSRDGPGSSHAEAEQQRTVAGRAQSQGDEKDAASGPLAVSVLSVLAMSIAMLL